MHNKEITTLLSDLANSDQILCDPNIFQLELRGGTLPVITVKPEDICLSLEDQNAFSISGVPILMKSVQSSVDPKAILYSGKVDELKARLLQALRERQRAETELLSRYGILCRYTIPCARRFSDRVDSSLPGSR